MTIDRCADTWAFIPAVSSTGINIIKKACIWSYTSGFSGNTDDVELSKTHVSIMIPLALQGYKLIEDQTKRKHENRSEYGQYGRVKHIFGK